jgi:hypothetical protein
MKYYYKNTIKNSNLFNYYRNKFNINLEKNILNIHDEIWIDFNLKWGINKVNYYIWLYK